MKPLQVKDGYHVTCAVSSNFLLDDGCVAENLQKENIGFRCIVLAYKANITITRVYTPANKSVGINESPCRSACLSVHLVCLSLCLHRVWVITSYTLCQIWIIIHTINVHDPRVCHGLDRRSYLQG